MDRQTRDDIKETIAEIIYYFRTLLDLLDYEDDEDMIIDLSDAIEPGDIF